MVSTILLAAIAAGEPSIVKVELPPPVMLASAVVDAVGATTQHVRLDTDPSVTTIERDEILDALEATGLFDAKPARGDAAPDVAAVVLVVARRTDPEALTVDVIDPAGRHRWSGRIAWTARTHTPGAALEPNEAASRYHRAQLTLETRVAMDWYAVPTLGPPNGRLDRVPIVLGTGPVSQAGPVPEHIDMHAELDNEKWRIVRGQDEVLDEHEFALLVGDAALAQEITEVRDGRRLTWMLGFGLASAGSLAAGIPLVLAPELGASSSDTLQTVGASLLIFAGVCAALTAVYPWLDPAPVQDVADAKRRVDAYNAQLRRELRDDPAAASGP